MDNVEFIKFIESLSNPEKTRNFNVFREYDPQPYFSFVKSLGLNKKSPSELLRIAIVGTNGKGSVSHFLEEIFRRAGFLTGLYTSPHLRDPLERIQIHGSKIEPIVMDSILRGFRNREINFDLESLSYFELFTLFALQSFRDSHCEIQVLEAGLGGRLDATKSAEADAVVVCSIGFDHTEILGDTLERILSEKLEIASGNCKIIYSMRQADPRLNEQILMFCEDRGIDCIFFENLPHEDYREHSSQFAKFISTDISSRFGIHLPDPTEWDLTNPKGRLEYLNQSKPVLFDIGHNPQAVRRILAFLNSNHKGKTFDVILGLMKDKDSDTILAILKQSNQVKTIYSVQGESFTSLEESTKIQSCDLKSFLETTPNPSLILGSFRLYPLVCK